MIKYDNSPYTYGACAFQGLHHHLLGRWSSRQLLAQPLAAGQSPKEIAPDLYKLAWRKQEKIATSLTDGRWTHGLRHLSTTEEINQYVEIWALVHEVKLSDQPDDIL